MLRLDLHILVVPEVGSEGECPASKRLSYQTMSDFPLRRCMFCKWYKRATKFCFAPTPATDPRHRSGCDFTWFGVASRSPVTSIISGLQSQNGTQSASRTPIHVNYLPNTEVLFQQTFSLILVSRPTFSASETRCLIQQNDVG